MPLRPLHDDLKEFLVPENNAYGAKLMMGDREFKESVMHADAAERHERVLAKLGGSPHTSPASRRTPLNKGSLSPMAQIELDHCEEPLAC